MKRNKKLVYFLPLSNRRFKVTYVFCLSLISNILGIDTSMFDKYLFTLIKDKQSLELQEKSTRIFFIGHASEKVIKRGRRDNVLSYLPLCHVAEQLFSVFNAMHSGYTANFGESIRTIQQDLRDIAPTIFLGVPRIWEKMQSDILIQSKKKNLDLF